MSSAQYYIAGDQTHLVLLMMNTFGLFYCLKALAAGRRPPGYQRLKTQ